jgi:hypothetical protein
MDSLRGIVSDLRVFLYGGIRTLPLTIAGTMTILGLFTANYAMMFFLTGFLIGVPIFAAILNKLADFLVVSFKDSWPSFANLFMGKSGDVCSVVIPFSTIDKPVRYEQTSIFCSTSLAMTAFFLGYILTNAVTLYQRKEESGSEPSKVSKRKSHALLAIATIVIFTLIIIGLRWPMKCESGFGMVLGMGLFGAAGYKWYDMLSSFTEGRLADLFGISNRIISSTARSTMAGGPVACIAT